jgi:uncharacterized protein involved in exopolysaccharide biosynthesis
VSATSDRVVYGDGDVDIAALAARLWSRKSWIALTTVLFVAGFAVAAFTMTPMYRATTVVMPASSNTSGLGSLTSALGQLSGLASLAGISPSSGNVDVEEALAVLRSRAFIERFIADNDLLRTLLYQRWDDAANRWKGTEDTWPTPAEGYRHFTEEVSNFTRDSRTGLITIQIVWKDPEQAAQWANELGVSRKRASEHRHHRDAPSHRPAARSAGQSADAGERHTGVCVSRR